MAWIISTVPIESIGLMPHSDCNAEIKKFVAYSKLPAETAPPIDCVLVNGIYQIANGLHRYSAALLRGDKEVKVSFWRTGD